MVIEQLLPFIGSLRDEVVVVTGASSGIGRTTAELFGRLGASVALVARRQAQLEETAQAIAQYDGRALIVPCDVTDAAAVVRAIATIKRRWKRIDVLVNNAGILIPGPVHSLTAADLERMLRVNLFGCLFATQAVLPGMQRRRRGSIINVASLGGRRGVSPLGGYCATKFALVGLTEALRLEVADTNVHIGLVLPGVVETPMVQSVDQEQILKNWPSILNMPPEWVAAAIVLAARFRMREISVPPGAATVELLAAIAPALSDSVIAWGQTASQWIAAAMRQLAPARSAEKR
jgi:NAD(P)-dependent dehydrogenase (short-subunit alcohol dehydrogenase family)